MKAWIYKRYWRVFFFLVGCVAAFGHFHGGSENALGAFAGLLVILWIVATLVDLLWSFSGHMIDHNRGTTINIFTTEMKEDHPVVEGKAKHPDPTRPDDEDWPGAITEIRRQVRLRSS